MAMLQPLALPLVLALAIAASQPQVLGRPGFSHATGCGRCRGASPAPGCFAATSAAARSARIRVAGIAPVWSQQHALARQITGSVEARTEATRLSWLTPARWLFRLERAMGGEQQLQ